MKPSKRARSVPVAITEPVQGAVTKKIDVALALKLRIQDRLTYEAIAERFDCTPESVRGSLRRFVALADNPEELEAYRRSKAHVFEALEQALLERLHTEVLSGRASIGDLARAIDVITKHVRLLAGQSTQNIGLLVQTLGDVHKDVIGAVAVDAQVVDNTGDSGGDARPVPATVS